MKRLPNLYYVVYLNDSVVTCGPGLGTELHILLISWVLTRQTKQECLYRPQI